AQPGVNLLGRNGTPGLLVCLATADGLQDVKVVLHVFQTAIVRKTIQQGAYCVFRCHENPGCPEHASRIRGPQREFKRRYRLSLAASMCESTWFGDPDPRLPRLWPRNRYSPGRAAKSGRTSGGSRRCCLEGV